MKKKLQEFGVGASPPSLGEDGLPDDAQEWTMFCLEHGVPWYWGSVAGANELCEWLDQNTEQNVWALLVLGLNYDLEVCERALLHMLGHPACSQLVALTALQWAEAPTFFGEEASAPHGFTYKVVKSICLRDAKEGFQVSDLLDPYEVDRWELIDNLEERAEVATPHFPAPTKLINSEEGSQKFRRPYVIEECEICKLEIGRIGA